MIVFGHERVSARRLFVSEIGCLFVGHSGTHSGRTVYGCMCVCLSVAI